MLLYFIVIAGLSFLFVKVTMDVLNWNAPEVTQQPTQSSDSGMLAEIHAQDEYYTGDLGDEV
jgi:large-conductance mechanosensitive channel